MGKKKPSQDEKTVQVTLGEPFDVTKPAAKTTKKTEPPKASKTKKTEVKKAAKKIETKKPVTKKSAKKVETEKAVTKKVAKKTEAKKAAKKAETKKAAKKPEKKKAAGAQKEKKVQAKSEPAVFTKKARKAKAPKTQKKKTPRKVAKSTPKPKKKAKAEPIPEDPLLKQLPGVGDKLYARLISAKYFSVEQISRARPESLSRKIDGLSVDGATNLISSAKSLLQKKDAETSEAEGAGAEVSQGPLLKDIKGVGPKLATKLAAAGYDSVGRLSRAHPEGLSKSVAGLSRQKAAEIIETARQTVQKQEIEKIGEEPASRVILPTVTPEEKPKPEPKTEEKPAEESAKQKVPEPAKKPEAPPPRKHVFKTELRKKKPVVERKKPRRFKSNLPVPEPVTDLAVQMKKQWKTAEKQIATSGTSVETAEVLNLAKEDTMDRLVDVAVDILNEAMTTGRPAFEIPSRSGDNIVWDEVRDLLLLGLKTISRPYHSLASVVDATRTARVMEIVFQLLQAGLHATKREVYYSDVNLFRDQKYSDKIIEDVASMLQTTRDSVHVVAAARGSAMGRVVVRDGGDLIDLTKMGTGGWAITPFLDQVEIVESDAEFILLSEKDAAVMRLAEAKYWNRQPCIVITGKGSGDMATRAFLKQLVKELEIPAFALVDSDPYGHYIYSVFLRGSKRLSYESPFIATPELKLLGVLSRDLDAYKVPKAVRIPMEPADVKRVKDMLKEPFVANNGEWVEDLELMLRLREKAEIQAFASHSFEYLTDEYIPTKLETGDWI